MERLDRFMARANAAYYAVHDPFADFTTSPEISQVFGEVLGLWAAVTWRSMSCPTPVVLAEAGPGRGTLMRDALRAIRSVAPDFAAALSLHLVETSPRLRAVQAALLPDATWHDRIETLPDVPLLLLANEFLDALPIRQFVRRCAGWAERYVDGAGFAECPTVDEPAVDELTGAAEDGQIRERCDAALAIAAALGRRFTARPGAALFLDYGPERSMASDSLQALRGGRPADPLADPGEADLTAHVDFQAIAEAAAKAGAVAHGPVPQGIFLARLGLFRRTDRLARGQPPDRALALIGAARRLAEPDRMGRLFKALALCHPGCPAPPGFEAE
jgi:SAM-dependent MidA family methyltransferase